MSTTENYQLPRPLLTLPRGRKVILSLKARSAARPATCAPKRHSTATLRFCACTAATRFSQTIGTPTKCLSHARNNFEGYTFAMRTLEAWGAMIENDHRAYYTAGGRVWIMDLEPCEGKKPRLGWRWARQELGSVAPHPAHRRHAGDCRVLTFALRDRGYEVFATGFSPARLNSLREQRADALVLDLHGLRHERVAL